MNRSKFIKSLIIKSGSQEFEVSIDRELDLMRRNVSEEVFGKEDIALDENVLIDLLYDNERFSDLHVESNHAYFCEVFSTNVLKFRTDDESNEEKFEAMIKETIEVLRQHLDSLIV